MLDPFSFWPYGGGAMLPEPTSGSQDWARAGEANDAVKAAMTRIFFIFISMFVGMQ
jgi:hypothetical protein